jgi:hypothetical protein
MKKAAYQLNDQGEFIIENYNKTKAFSSFFPGIAGLEGIPLWAFYVNRGQCISSFGTENKDGGILEFYPANQAYHLTSIRGFRTHMKLRRKNKVILYEPFKDLNLRDSQETSTRMIIKPSSLKISEINRRLKIRTEVEYATVVNEPYAGLTRKLVIVNESSDQLSGEIVDGLSQIVPYGMDLWYQKHMSRTCEAWIEVLNLRKKAPFYKLKIDPQDKPELEYIERGNFYAAFKEEAKKRELLEAIVDPDLIYAEDGDLSYPRAFYKNKSHDLKNQKTQGKMPSAFSFAKFKLKAKESAKIFSIAGNARSKEEVNAIVKRIVKEVDGFDKKLNENREIIDRLESRVFTHSQSREFDYYTKQTFLDNLLRGGWPHSLKTKNKPLVYYAYGRKHGDLERDYNDFNLKPTFYSQGNGAYRDINQNRRNDPLFNPDVGDENILTFMNAIQLDGYNPLCIEGVSFRIKSKGKIDSILKRYIKSKPAREKLKGFLSKDFDLGELVFLLKTRRTLKSSRVKNFLQEILTYSKKEDVFEPGEGFWIDHWSYNTDLIESYLKCFPDRLKELLLDKKEFSFFDTYNCIMPRDEKYIFIDGKIRQFASVREDKNKKLAIQKRTDDKYKVRTKDGKIYKTNLLVKLLCLIANRMATLDPFGTGIEMEADKPGWCDGLNGLPGLFGSSICQTYELKRLILFIKSSLEKINISDAYKILLFKELNDFIGGLKRLINKNIKSKSKNKNYLYWDLSAKLKEEYREKAWQGINGKETPLSIKELKDTLDIFLIKLDKGLKTNLKGSKDVPVTYYINEVEGFKFIYENNKKKTNEDGLPIIKALSFKQKPVPLFLEGPVHAMRIMDKKKALALHKKIRRSSLFDKNLRMYKINEPLLGAPQDIGRSSVFTPGWLENESIWLHMEYKYLLELIKKGLDNEFFLEFKNCLICYQQPERYGRSTLENSSFLVSSAYPDKALHGRGFVARLTGSTTEFLNMWLIMSLGNNPFRLDERDRLFLIFEPSIPEWLFTKKKQSACFYFSNKNKREVELPENTFSVSFLGQTLLVYHNPKRKNAYGKNKVVPGRVVLKGDSREIEFNKGIIPAPFAKKVRDGQYKRIDVHLE